MALYGPAGLRTFIRTIMQVTLTGTADRYVVHELLRDGEIATPCGPEDLHPSEAAGQDIYCDEDGFWREFVSVKGKFSKVVVDAASIVHRGP